MNKCWQGIWYHKEALFDFSYSSWFMNCLTRLIHIYMSRGRLLSLVSVEDSLPAFVVQLLSRVQFSVCRTAWTAAHQASLSLTIFWSLPKFMSTESVMPSIRLILGHPLFLLLPSIFPSIRVFSSESAFPIRWSKHWSFSFSIGPSNEYSGLIFLSD